MGVFEIVMEGRKFLKKRWKPDENISENNNFAWELAQE